MVNFYDKDLVLKFYKKKKSLITFYVFVTIVAILLVGGILLAFSFEPYGSKFKLPFLIAIFVVTCSFVFFSFLFFVIIYGRTKKYYEFIYYACYGVGEIAKVTITHVESKSEDVLGIDYYAVTALYWSDVVNNYFERKLYIDCEIKSFNVSEGDVLTLKIVSNCIVGYEEETV